MARVTGKETATETLERETVQGIGSLLAPSMLERVTVTAYVKLPLGSQYRVIFRDGSCETVSQSALRRLLLENVAEEAAV